jgi:hypothetical protein
MLKILSMFDQPLTEKIEIGEYNPITILWGTSIEAERGYLSDLHQYWSMESPNTLVEIGLDIETHSIRIVKIPLTMRFNKSEINIDCQKVSEAGLPICDTSAWASSDFLTNYYYKEEGFFDVFVGKDNVRLIFSERRIDRQITADKVWFGMDDNDFLCAIGIDRLVEEEIEKLIGTLEYQRISAAP